MVNLNGTLVVEPSLALDNRGYQYGDALFETIRANKGVLLFWEDHYFRLMAGMRVLRMEIPMQFTPEFLEKQIKECIEANGLTSKNVRVKINVHRVSGGLYTPENRSVEYSIHVSQHELTPFYNLLEQPYEVTLYKDHYVAKDLLSTFKTNSKLVSILGSIYAKENNFANCLVLNTDKKIIETLNGNIFLVKDTLVKTPPLNNGCLRGIVRKQLLTIIPKIPGLTLVEESISPFELQQADELFSCNVIQGIVAISKYRKKSYASVVTKKIIDALNAAIQLRD